MAMRFITFEGGEGSGKSTQAKILSQRLASASCSGGGLGRSAPEVVLTREPGGAPLAERIRAVVLEQAPTSRVAECLLFAAARAEHIAVTIAPALARGAFVVCDRFIDSTRVYQGSMGRVDPSLIAQLELATVTPYVPTLTLILDVPPEIGLERAAQRGTVNRFEDHDLAWHRRLREGFIAIGRADPERCRIINADRTAEAIAKDVWAAVASVFASDISPIERN